MDNKQASFQDRIKKIEKKRPPTEPQSVEDLLAEVRANAASAPRGPDMAIPMAETDWGAKKKILGVAFGAICAAGAALFAFDIFSMVAAPEDEVVEFDDRLGEPVQAGLFGGASDAGGGKAPLAYLPEAPSGFMRITAYDAEDPNLLGSLPGRWSDATGQPSNTLNGNPALSDLTRFIRDNRSGANGPYSTTAFYIGTDGTRLTTKLEFLAKSDALGSADASETWARELSTRETVASGAGSATVQSLRGATFVNMSAVSVEQPSTAVTTVDMVVPVTHRVLLHIQGNGRMDDAIRIVNNTDRRALLARLN